MKIFKEIIRKVITEDVDDELDMEETDVDTEQDDEVDTEDETDIDIDNGEDTNSSPIAPLNPDNYSVIDNNFPEPTVYKVSFKLGSHENWSRFEADNEETAKEEVEKYIKQKYPDREYEFIDVEEYVEEEEDDFTESLTEDLDDDLSGPPEGAEAGLSELIIQAINDEWEMIRLFDTLSITSKSEGFEDISAVIDDINIEEHKHIGQLQEALKLLSPNTIAIEDGEQEGAEQLDNNY